MFKILKKIKFDEKDNRMTKVQATEEVIKNYNKGKNKNLDYLLSKRFSWMNNFIRSSDVGLEVGAGAGLSKKFILNKNLNFIGRIIGRMNKIIKSTRDEKGDRDKKKTTKKN